MGSKNKFNESYNEIIRKRRVGLAFASFAIGVGHACFELGGDDIPDMAKIAVWAGPSVAQGTLEAFVNKAYIKNMFTALISGRGKSYVGSAIGGAVTGASLAAASNGLGYLVVIIGYDVNRYFSGYG